MKRQLLILMLFLIVPLAKAEEHLIVTSDSVKLYVNVKGKGIPCLYLHGGPGSGSLWLEKLFGEFLEQHFQMVYLDQRGVGRSGSPSNGDYSIDRMILDFEEIRKELGINNWLTLSHSFGGILQMEYAIRHTDANMGLIMICPTLSMANSFCNSWLPEAWEILYPGVQYICTDDSLTLPERLNTTIEELYNRDLAWKMSFQEKDNERVLMETYSGIKDWNGDFSNIALYISDYWKDYLDVTPLIGLPVLWFYGNADKMAGANQAGIIAFPESIIVASDGGHFPFLESRDELENSIINFITIYNFQQ